MTLSQFADKILACKNQPHELADLAIDISAKYGKLSEKMKDIQMEKAVFWNCKFAGDKPLSDTHIEAKWMQEESGKSELRIKYELKALEKLLGAIKNSIIVNSVEAKNQF